MRKQYHLQPAKRGFNAWDVHRLIALSKNFEPKEIPISEIKEIDENFWYQSDDSVPSLRSILMHMTLIEQCNLNFPIILSSTGRVMDGMHRIGKAILEERKTIMAVQFEEDPKPDFFNVQEDELSYD